MRSFSTLVVAGLALAGCGGTPYGFAREYTTYGDEDAFFEQASAATYEDVRRSAPDYTGSLIGWFGVVTAVAVEDDNDQATVRVQFEHRVHQDRHLCRDERSVSCRVTVAARSGGNFSALLHLRPEDVSGQDRLNVGSLLKIYGTPQGQLSADGDPVVEARYYRHWPRGYFVTTASRDEMRR